MATQLAISLENYLESPEYNESLLPFLTYMLDRHAQHGGVTEVRIIVDKPFKAVFSGYFDPEHKEVLIGQLLPEERMKIPFGQHGRIGEGNIYICLNAAHKDLLARSAYEFGKCQATSDDWIAAYGFLPIDIDPVRPAGISATDEEKEHAHQLTLQVLAHLQEKGVGAIEADSGNGYHLLVPTVAYPDAKKASEKAHALLQMLDKQFSTEHAKIDTTVANPARIFKVYGTLAMKGSSIPERPHRYAVLHTTEMPPDVDLFEIFQAELEAGQPPAPSPPAEGPDDDETEATPASAWSGSGWDFETKCKVLEGLLTWSGLEFQVKHKDEDKGRIFAFKDCPHHTDHDGDHYECSVMVKPDGKFAAKCMHDENAHWKDFKPLIGWDEHIAPVKEELGLPSSTIPYQAMASGLVWLKPTSEGCIPIPLTNFDARIVANIVEDDGAERRTLLEIQATLNGQQRTLQVPASEFGGMGWVLDNLGGKAILRAGQGVKDHTRVAIQMLSENMVTREVFTHTGWRTHGGVPIYLHAGGAIGPEGVVEDVQVALSGPFSRYVLPEPPTGADLVQAVRASLRMTRTAPQKITFPYFAAIYRAPLGPADFSLHLSGPTGQGKTVLAVLGMQHFGRELDAAHIPGNWSSTANALEGMAFTAKDSLFLVDDFAPGTSAQEVNRLHRDADRLLRNQANGGGRNRMRADSSLRPTKYPRGLIISTGEDIPRGQSLRARLLILEVSPGMVNWPRATVSQQDAAQGLYAASMAGYIQWVAKRYEVIRTGMAERISVLREAATDSDQHKRTPGIVANLFYGVELFGMFAAEVGALNETEVAQMRELAWQAIGEAAAAQVVFQASSEPAQRFLTLLNAAIAAGQAHVASTTGNAPANAIAWGWRFTDHADHPRGDRVGWLDGTTLYLEPDASFTAAQRMGNGTGEPLAVTSLTCHKRLHEQGKLVAVDETRKRLTVRRTLEGKNREVLYLAAASLSAG